MQRRQRPGECDYCDTERSSLRACSGCHNAWYCDPECQKAHWKSHRIWCLHPSKLTSADRLAIAAYKDFLPNEHDIQVLRDYGFARAQISRSENWLLGLFQGIIKYGQVDPRVIHRQRLAGTLIDYIKSFYEKMPAYARGDYYPWFLKNQHLLEPPKFSDTYSVILNEDSFQHTWRFIGGLTPGSPVNIKSQVQDWPKEKQQAFRFVQFLLHPRFQLSPDLPEWIDFGFCGCNSHNEEMELWDSYIKLTKAVPFEKFHIAYSNSSLPALFSANGSTIMSPFVLDVLDGTPHKHKSVWDLKRFALGDYQKLTPSVIVDYGFMNCGDLDSPEGESVIHSLRQVYKTILTIPDVNPLQLHEACLQGELFHYARQVTQVDIKFAPLMKNIYPLQNNAV
ncbi:unnamed protein product [Rhizoctonia solani]|uniref:MYND-type domain-containing protein n=1 Tax=Rhizoctonia solani TaxID=456999 RepID=A0A8H3GJ36_9AGAM|nr:unnamed protein product [Rhizoctonia solani]